ncbi:hypothetical protein NDI56_19240 [Haloarcula sp. S1CR25-12]|uniref:DNA recombination and repair protein Rad51-like C-terminal domain-containing protein n=1 Tax=Haloarcula saliterrae TaxID=2950534 RepID=A0ABU2FGZ7_9EURY|nr:hypothetical protein [Haloarcula sp. S1CR25-12]MDS0261540.1 hypothetical protein [Haloarcula sp. S1CR25-12]
MPNHASENSTGRPRRGTDSLVDRQRDRPSLLPDLDPGVTLLDVDGGRGVPVVQSLVLDRLLTCAGPAFWVDARGYATTTALARLAPSRRLLDRVHVARGFTAYQHYSAVRDLPGAVSDHVTTAADSADRAGPLPAGDADAPTPSLVVAPAVDAFYRADDALTDAQSETLQTRTLAALARYADGYDVPVLVTRTADDAFAAPVAAAADRRLRCERTSMGPRFVGEEFETLVYPVGDGSHYQTTLAYWRDILATRARRVGVEPTPAPAREASAAPTVDPIADAFAGPGGR